MTDRLLETFKAVEKLVAAGKIPCDPRIVKLLALALQRIELLDKGVWSTHADTLARKAMATCEKILIDVSEERMDPATGKIALDAVYDTVVGLVSMKNCADLLLEARKELA